jgi:anti-anti-sigma factor
VDLQALGIEENLDHGAVVLALHGEADLATAPRLALALAKASEHGTADVVLEAASLEFIDSSCLRLIADARARLREQGRDLWVRSPALPVRRMLTILEMEDLVERPDDPALALMPALSV